MRIGENTIFFYRQSDLFRKFSIECWKTQIFLESYLPRKCRFQCILMKLKTISRLYRVCSQFVHMGFLSLWHSFRCLILNCLLCLYISVQCVKCSTCFDMLINMYLFVLLYKGLNVFLTIYTIYTPAYAFSAARQKWNSTLLWRLN